MPNHVHVVFQPYPEYSLSDIMHSWKSYTAKNANTLLGRSGSFWQVEAYDHLIRSEKELFRQMQYVWENPERAGLRGWKWRWKMEFEEAVTLWHEHLANLRVA